MTLSPCIPAAKQHARAALGPLAVGCWAAAIALTPGVSGKLVLIVPPLLAVLVWWVVQQPSRWMGVFFCCLLLTPPLPLPLGDSGVHLAPFAACLGILSGLIFAREWGRLTHPLMAGIALFTTVLIVSASLAALYSGWEIGAGSLARVLLFAIGAYVFLYCFAGPGQDATNDLRMVRLLFFLGAAGAVFACADFYLQLPAPAGFSDQFVWLDEGVLRRAQGLFYEASTLGNVCAFFLVMIAVALSGKRERSPVSRTALLLGAVTLGAALMFSYSRASAFNVAIALLVLACIRLRRFRRSFVGILAAALVAGTIVNLALPSFSSNYWGRLLGSFSFFWQSPDAVLSGRLSHWQALLAFLAREPWHAILGIGYKTLPYSNFTGAAVIADNTYLDLLVETGIVGLAAFLLLNGLILRTGWRALHSADRTTAFLGEWIFCFWCGQLAQMFSGDLITYWRALPIYFWVLGAAARKADRQARRPG